MTNLEWQPIETAPKDRFVLLFCPSMGVIRGKWRDDRYMRKPRPYWTNDSEAWMGKIYTRSDQPTHWMPLPEPPKVQP